MSIILNISKEDSYCEVEDTSCIINTPRGFSTNRNDLSGMDVSLSSGSSKYTHSGCDLSFDSQGVNTKVSLEDIIMKTNTERGSPRGGPEG
jgi:hypothetical protein